MKQIASEPPGAVEIQIIAFVHGSRLLENALDE
jgi:hypothetical protein